ncbi:hypothetical protein ASPVEDRAFT_289667 [Aspergillus versicolor CBS 583.65]|uniref:Uncharacterized protein n=1 Tax=Aspergillus versicolor CBS 583.65 TaxID=1036611 RepID=A0A1L9P779_ASPVE|nr:uncharacterized protein ASPVEDRAFT_289667 [Aspergillus versicolor CBS 583.65]OJI97377.1 hypothetical protein ASPVEDRAFT_289667 [Aspergillus versicolor CBS 583.65]
MIYTLFHWQKMFRLSPRGISGIFPCWHFASSTFPGLGDRWEKGVQVKLVYLMKTFVLRVSRCHGSSQRISDIAVLPQLLFLRFPFRCSHTQHPRSSLSQQH